METKRCTRCGETKSLDQFAQVLATTLVFISEFDLSRSATWLYLAFIVVALTGLALFSWLQQRRVASAGAH